MAFHQESHILLPLLQLMDFLMADIDLQPLKISGKLKLPTLWWCDLASSKTLRRTLRWRYQHSEIDDILAGRLDSGRLRSYSLIAPFWSPLGSHAVCSSVSLTYTLCLSETPPYGLMWCFCAVRRGLGRENAYLMIRQTLSSFAIRAKRYGLKMLYWSRAFRWP